MSDDSPRSTADTFPAPEYRDTVLAPLFEAIKRHHWRDLMRVHRAHAVMLAECGLLTSPDAAAIVDAIDAIESDLAARLDGLHYRGIHEDFFYFVEAELRARLGIGIAGRLHTGRSRNDMDQTMLKIALKRRLLTLSEALVALVEALLTMAARHRDTLVLAYTHGQPAQPTTWGHYLSGMIEVLLRDAGRILHAYETADQCSMGAAAITTTGFAIDRGRIARLLGFAHVQENSYGAIAACDHVTEAFATVKTLLINVGRFVQDLGFWTAFEVGHLVVPDGFVQCSSIMPQKRNPVPIEHLRLLCSIAIGHCDAVVLAMHNTPFTDVNDNEYTVHESGYDAIDTTERVLALLSAFVQAVRVHEEAVRRHVEASCATMTELADSLVREEGIAFGEAHEICSHLARSIVTAHGTLATVPYATFVDAFRAVTGRSPQITEAAFRTFATPEHFIAIRTRPGGPAPAPMDQSLAGYRAAVASVRATLAAHHHRIEAAEMALSEATETLRGIPSRPPTPESRAR